MKRKKTEYAVIAAILAVVACGAIMISSLSKCHERMHLLRKCLFTIRLCMRYKSYEEIAPATDGVALRPIR